MRITKTAILTCTESLGAALFYSDLRKYVNINTVNLKNVEKHKKEMIFSLKIVTRNVYPSDLFLFIFYKQN